MIITYIVENLCWWELILMIIYMDENFYWLELILMRTYMDDRLYGWELIWMRTYIVENLYCCEFIDVCYQLIYRIQQPLFFQCFVAPRGCKCAKTIGFIMFFELSSTQDLDRFRGTPESGISVCTKCNKNKWKASKTLNYWHAKWRKCNQIWRNSIIFR